MRLSLSKQLLILLVTTFPVIQLVTNCSPNSPASSSRILDSSVPGGCRMDDEMFNTEEGGCLDFASGLVWSRRSVRPETKQLDAVTYCQENREGKFSDWRLPTGKNLEELAKDGRVTKYFRFSVSGFFWGDAAGSTDVAPIVSLLDGESVISNLKDTEANVICVRQPSDIDADHVPDSSDHCSQTPSGQTPTTIGERKGCAPDDDTYEVPGKFPSMSAYCRSLSQNERVCRKTKGCGWANGVGCMFILSDKCEDYRAEWFCRSTSGCSWIDQHCIKR